MSDDNRTVGVLIFDSVEVLDFCGPYEVFSIASRPDDTPTTVPPFTAFTIARTPALVVTVGGLRVQPHHTFEDHPPLDILVIPGGIGTRPIMRDPQYLEWIRRQAGQVEITASVCTGALVLAEAGLLTGGPATTHWSVIDWMRSQYPNIDVRDDQRVIDRGTVITSAGVSAGIDMALHIVERLLGTECASAAAREMEYERRSVPVEAAR